MLRFFLITGLLSIVLQVSGQTNIHIQINGYRDPWLVCGYYQGGKSYRLDSLRNTDGAGHFTLAKKDLIPGMYFCGTGKTALLEFLIVSPSDSFEISARIDQPDSLQVSHSPENERYLSFEQARRKLESEIDAKKTMRDMVAQATHNDAPSLEPYDRDIRQLLERTDSLALAFMRDNPGDLFARMLRSVRLPEPPENLSKPLANGKPNPALSRWQRRHYWDHTDFRDESLLGNKFWHVYFDRFFARFVAPQPDSMITAIDEALENMPVNGAFYRFALMRITPYYEQNDAPGSDRIFVHLVDRYHQKDRTPWLDAATLERLAYKADSHRSNLTGSLALNFTLPDENGKPVELYGIEAPLTILVFYSPLCSHCMELMPKIYQVYLDYQPKNLAAVALNTDGESAYWNKFVRQQNWAWYDVDDPVQMPQLEKQYAASNLPVIYLLDKDKRILAKRIKPEDLGKVLAIYFARH